MAFTLKNQGIYQIANARLALTIANKLITLDSETTEKAIESAVWYGRFEMMTVAGRQVILDGAHNTDGIKALLSAVCPY
jgi:dihydrofolate synthase/folylpolyglutamate synthase